MDNKETPILPFLVREMLRFGSISGLGLRITTQASLAATFTLRGITREGTFEYAHSNTGDTLIQTQDFGLSDIPILLSITDDSGTLTQGEAFVTIDLLINGDSVHQLCAGMVYKNKGITFPATNEQEHVPGRGKFKSSNITSPAAGAEFTQTVPTGAIWRVQSLSFLLTTDANVANRRVHINFDNAGSIQINTFCEQDQAAGVARRYSVAKFGYAPDSLDDNDILVPMPEDIWLQGGATIKSETTNIQAGDAFTSIGINVEEFFRKE